MHVFKFHNNFSLRNYYKNSTQQWLKTSVFAFKGLLKKYQEMGDGRYPCARVALLKNLTCFSVFLYSRFKRDIKVYPDFWFTSYSSDYSRFVVVFSCFSSFLQHHYFKHHKIIKSMLVRFIILPKMKEKQPKRYRIETNT